MRIENDIAKNLKCTYFGEVLACMEKNPINIARIDNRTQAKKIDAHLLTYLTPINTRSPSKSRSIEP